MNCLVRLFCVIVRSLGAVKRVSLACECLRMSWMSWMRE